MKCIFGQLTSDASIGDLIEFLQDNPGAIRAVIDWIGEGQVDEWKESLESQLADSEEDEDE